MKCGKNIRNKIVLSQQNQNRTSDIEIARNSLKSINIWSKNAKFDNN